MLVFTIIVQGVFYSVSMLGVKTIINTDNQLKHIELELKGIVNKKTKLINHNGNIIFEESFEKYLSNRKVSIKNIIKEDETVSVLVSLPLLGNRKITLYKV